VLIFASIITFKKGIFTVGLDALILAGAVLGFLPYNFPEAKTFIGDCGAQTLGFILGILSIVGTFKSTAGIIFFGFCYFSFCLWKIRFLHGLGALQLGNIHLPQTGSTYITSAGLGTNA